MRATYSLYFKKSSKHNFSKLGTLHNPLLIWGKKTNKVEPVTTGILLQPLGEMRDEGKMVGKNRRHQACRH